MKKGPRTVAVIMPVSTAVPRAFWAPDPAPGQGGGQVHIRLFQGHIADSGRLCGPCGLVRAGGKQTGPAAQEETGQKDAEEAASREAGKAGEAEPGKGGQGVTCRQARQAREDRHAFLVTSGKNPGHPRNPEIPGHQDLKAGGPAGA